MYSNDSRSSHTWIDKYIQKSVERKEKKGETHMESVSTALVTSFTGVASSLTGIIGDVLPVALPVVGAVIVVTTGIRIFKKIVTK